MSLTINHQTNDISATSGSVTIDGATPLTALPTITLSGDVSGSGTTSIAVTVADDSHNHVISNIDGLQTELDAKYSSANPPPASDPSTAQVLSATAGASAGAVGTYAFLRRIDTTTAVNFGTTISGSNLNPAGLGSNSWTNGTTTGGFTAAVTYSTTISGTWRSLGYTRRWSLGSENGTITSATLWLRIS